MKKVLIAAALALVTASTASAFEVVTGQGTINAVVTEGKAYSIPIKRICGMATFKAASRHDVGRDGKYVTIDGVKTRIVCPPPSLGGSATSGESPDMDRLREVVIRPGEEIREDDTPNDVGEPGTNEGNDSDNVDEPGKPDKISG